MMMINLFFSNLYKLSHLVSLQNNVKIRISLKENHHYHLNVLLTIFRQNSFWTWSINRYDLIRTTTSVVASEFFLHTIISNRSSSYSIRLTSLEISFAFLDLTKIDIAAKVHQGLLTRFNLFSLVSINSKSQFHF